MQLSDSTTDDFALLRRNDWINNVGWMYGKHILKVTAKTLISSFLSTARCNHLFGRNRRDRIASDDFPPHSFAAEFYCGAIMILYSIIFVCAWTFYFPSPTEQILWRVASAITLGFSFPLGFGLMYIDYMYFGRSRYSRRERDFAERALDRLYKLMKGQRIADKDSACSGDKETSE